MKKIVILLAAFMLMVLSACSSDGYTDLSMVTLRYEKGASQGGKFVDCVSPGEKIVTNDALYPYPNTQREAVWDSDNFKDTNGDGFGDGSADYPDLEVVDKNGVVSYVKMKVSFFLNTDCDVLREFHETIGKTRKAYFNEDGGYGNGWLWAMNNYVSSSITDYMVEAARSVSRDAETMWLKAEDNATMEKELAERLPSLVNAGMQGDSQFYQNFTVKIFSITPEDEYLNIFKDRQQAQDRAETAELNRSAAVAEAKAQAAVAAERAKIKQAEIEGYGGFENWNKSRAVEKGLNPYQPTYVVGGSNR